MTGTFENPVDRALFHNRARIHHVHSIAKVGHNAEVVGDEKDRCLPDPTARQTSDTTATSITNGLVSKVSPAAHKLTNTNMTNGIVSAEKGGAAGRALTVTYDGGSKSFRITVPPNAPITRYVLADRSAVAVESSVFIKTDPGDQAGLVTVGKGVTPPM
jgi:hypothetical protein